MAINFPNNPVDANTYTYNSVTYVYSQDGVDEGFWRVGVPASSGVASPLEIDTGTNNIKYVTPYGLNESKYKPPATPHLNLVRPIPDASLSWLTVLPKVTGLNSVSVTEGVNHFATRTETYAPTSQEMFVDPVNGNDSNAGFPASRPFKTLAHALRVSNAYKINLMGSDDINSPVVFDKSDFRDTDPVGNRLKNVISLGHCKISEPSEDYSSLTWTLEAGGHVWSAPTSTIELHQLRFTKTKDEDGGYLKIPRVPFNTDLGQTINDLNDTAFGWYHDISTNTLYVRVGQELGNVFKDFLVGTPATTASRMLFLGTAISFYVPKDSSLIFDGVYLVPLVSGTTRARLYMHAEKLGGITIANSFTHGIDCLGSTYYLQNVKAVSTSGDNFHGFDSAGISSRGVEINCESSFAGDFGTNGSETAGTDNGSAMHGTGHMARFGGRYFKNYGPDIVDSGSGAFWNVGVEAYGSTLANNAIGFDITAGSGRMYLDTCLARDEDLDEIQVNNGASLFTFNTTGNVTLVGTGTETPYDPMNP